MSAITHLVLNDVADERSRQDAKWGDQSDHSDERWLAILAEEFGEAARATLEASVANGSPEADGWRANLDAELLQVAAVAVAWVEALTRRRVRQEAR